MNDIGQKLRKGFFQALSGLISYEGSPIPVVDEKLDVNISEHDIYVMLLNQDEDLQTNQVKGYFSNETLSTMKIVNQRKATNTKEIVENISDQILQIIIPSKNVHGLSIDTPLRISYCKFMNAQYDPIIKNETGFAIAKNLTFKTRVLQ